MSCRWANQLPFQVENYILNVKHEHRLFEGLRSGELAQQHQLEESVGSRSCRSCPDCRSLTRSSSRQPRLFPDGDPDAILQAWPNRRASLQFWVVSAHPGQPRLPRNQKGSGLVRSRRTIA
jgi:hypothetical protein